MKIRKDFLDRDSPAGLEVIQLQEQVGLSSSHIYMHAEIFTPDSRRFILHGARHSSDAGDKGLKGCYYLCDIENNGELVPLPREVRGKGVCVSPDGRYVYYFDRISKADGVSFELKRLRLDGGETASISVMGGGLVRMLGYPTVSSDGRRLATVFGISRQEQEIMVFDLVGGKAEMILHGQTWGNPHLQYCRSLEAEEAHDLLVQEVHSLEVIDPPGTHCLQDVDVHIIRDDGTNFRTLPWGRDGKEYCMGHQCWRGRSNWAITSTITHLPTAQNPGRTECQLIESRPVPHLGHIGRNHRDTQRNDLTRDFVNPQFYHFATDIAGQRLISDYWHPDGHQRHPQGKQLLYLARLSTTGVAPGEGFTYLLDTRNRPEKTTHAHPFLSPDGKYAFFNSDESGLCQAYMIRNLPEL